jgi:hypothetical protein
MMTEQELRELCVDDELHARMWRESLTNEQINTM